MAIFEPFLAPASAQGGHPPCNHRRVLDGIFWIARTGAPWRDLPAAFGNWNSIWRQFRRWSVSDVWDVLLQALADSGEADRLQMIDSITTRGVSLCRLKSGARNQALGRSRGVFSTKIYIRINANGLPIAVVVTAGEAYDVTAYADLMEQRNSEPGVLLADKGYDSDAIRPDARDRGATLGILTKREPQGSIFGG